MTRTLKGKIVAGPGLDQGTLGWGNNTAGDVTGFYYDSSSVAHGFLYTP